MRIARTRVVIGCDEQYLSLSREYSNRNCTGSVCVCVCVCVFASGLWCVCVCVWICKWPVVLCAVLSVSVDVRELDTAVSDNTQLVCCCRYHRVLRKEREKQERKNMQQLEKSDPEAYMQKLQQLDKLRLQVRVEEVCVWGGVRVGEVCVWRRCVLGGELCM